MAALVRGVRIDGLKDLDRALGQLSKATARNVLKRALVRAGAPIADAARALAPVADGELRDSIQVSSRVRNDVGKAEYAAVMREGGTRAQAGAALRGARRAAPGKSFAMVEVGPAQAKTKADAIKRIVQEFGSVRMAARPYMRPAWAMRQDDALALVSDSLADEIMKAAKRAESRARRLAAKK